MSNLCLNRCATDVSNLLHGVSKIVQRKARYFRGLARKPVGNRGRSGTCPEQPNLTSGQKGGSTFPVLALPPSALTTDHKLQWFGTTRPRLGFLATPNLLLYGTAGVAYGQTKDNYTVNTVGVGTAATASINDVRAGWTAGGGIEGAFGGGWSAKVE